jgi:hypothetical protein
MSGGSSSPTPTSTTTGLAALPDWAQGYAKDTLSNAASLTNINTNPYQQYDAQRIADFSPLQQQAQQGAANMQVSGAVGTGQDLATAGGIGALNMGANSFTDQGTAQQYMNPYLMSSLAPQMAMLGEQQGMQQAQNQAQATQAGAFGGSRMGVQNAQQNQANQLAMSNLVGQGFNNAFGQAQNQYNAEQNRGLQGLQTGIQAAGQLGALGQNEYTQNMGINQLQGQYGAQQQAQQQQGLTQSYQDFLNQQNYPYKQMGFMSDLIRGLPLGQQSTQSIYQAPPSALQSAGALGLGAIGLKQAGILGAAKGGQMKSYASGGSINPMDDPNRMTAAVSKLTDAQLQQILQRPTSAAERQAAQLELATRASEKQGLASAFNATPQATQMAQPQAQPGMKRGGIAHFLDGGPTDEDSGGGGDQYTQEDAQDAQDAQDEQTQGGNVSDAALHAQAVRAGLSSLRNAQNRPSPEMIDVNDPNNGLAANMATMRKLAGPDPYPEIKGQIATMANQSQQALEQGKGLAALHAMGALLQGPDFMRALGGAASSFSDSYGQALQAHRAAQQAQMQMSINVAAGQRAENLGLAKDAMASFQAANANRIAIAKAQNDRDKNLATAAARLANATKGPKPAAPVKPSEQQEYVNATPAERALMDQRYRLKAAGLAGPALTAAAANQRAAQSDALTLTQQDQTAREKAGKDAAAALLMNKDYRTAQRTGNKELAASIEKTAFSKFYNMYRPTGIAPPAPLDLNAPKAAPAAPAAPARPPAPATRIKFDANGQQIQ